MNNFSFIPEMKQAEMITVNNEMNERGFLYIRGIL